MDMEGTPLLGASNKVSPLHMKISGTNCLGTQAVKQCYFSSWSYTHCEEKQRKVRWNTQSKNGLDCKYWHFLELTVCIFQWLFLLRRLGDDLDSLAEEESNVGAVPIQHLHWQHEVFPFIRITDIQCLSCEVLKKREKTGFFFLSDWAFVRLSIHFLLVSFSWSRAKLKYPVEYTKYDKCVWTVSNTKTCAALLLMHPTFPSRLSCCISCSLLPIPMKAHGWASCSVHPSFFIVSNFFCQPLPNRYTLGGGQKNLNGTGKVNIHRFKCYFET